MERFESGESLRDRALEAGDVAGLEGAIAQALATLDTFHPREWVLENMTDAVCSRKLYELIMQEAGKARAGRVFR